MSPIPVPAGLQVASPKKETVARTHVAHQASCKPVAMALETPITGATSPKAGAVGTKRLLEGAVPGTYWGTR